MLIIIGLQGVPHQSLLARVWQAVELESGDVPSLNFPLLASRVVRYRSNSLRSFNYVSVLGVDLYHKSLQHGTKVRLCSQLYNLSNAKRATVRNP